MSDDSMPATERLVRAALELHRLAMPAREAESAPTLSELLHRADSLAREYAAAIEKSVGELRNAEALGADHSSSNRRLQPVGDDAPAVDIPPSVSLPDLAPWERHIWQTPDLTVEERRAAILLVRLQRGDLNDTGSLRKLYHSLGNVLRGRP